MVDPFTPFEPNKCGTWKSLFTEIFGLYLSAGLLVFAPGCSRFSNRYSMRMAISDRLCLLVTWSSSITSIILTASRDCRQINILKLKLFAKIGLPVFFWTVNTHRRTLPRLKCKTQNWMCPDPLDSNYIFAE